jgi:hypothetical protein
MLLPLLVLVLSFALLFLKLPGSRDFWVWMMLHGMGAALGITLLLTGLLVVVEQVQKAALASELLEALAPAGI